LTDSCFLSILTIPKSEFLKIQFVLRKWVSQLQINLAGKVAIVTGAGRGIGKAIAKALATANASVVINDVDLNAATEACQEIESSDGKARPAKADVRIRSEINQMVQMVIGELGEINILVNNAGVILRKPAEELSEEEWDKMLAINLKGVFLCCKAVVPYMKKKGYGKIINISSSAAVAPPAPLIHYSSAKAGILGLTLDLALELAPFNICVNAILPGVIPTEMWDELQILPLGMKKEDVFAEMGKMLAPMQRVGTPEDIGGAALFLASDLSAYVTGDRIIVAGGYPLKQFFK
jgi:NAD(P)-dependent dehydrogenase (short-subunit alcohol dehydrogenase family)